MIHTYRITGMTCAGCEGKVKSNLLMVPDVVAVDVSKEQQTATISMEKHIPLSNFQNALNKKYFITATEHSEAAEQAKNWFATYRPILLIFGYITTVSIIAATHKNGFDWMHAMNVFMAGFFLSFSFFKMLDIKGFAESYRMYDIVAKRFKAWGYFYPFIELLLGIAYATNFEPLITNVVTLVVMSISIIGVLQSALSKQKIKCACLGTVFNLPMSTVTIIEDGLMIAMSTVMLYQIF
jgi:copper chaperone CopZ